MEKPYIDPKLISDYMIHRVLPPMDQQEQLKLRERIKEIVRTGDVQALLDYPMDTKTEASDAWQLLCTLVNFPCEALST